MGCCGVREISGLSRHRTAKAAMRNVCRIRYHDSAGSAFLVFTGLARCRYGQRFCDFIKDNKLGSVVGVPRAKRNPNSGNPLKVWVWTVKDRELRAWYRKSR